MVQYPSIYTHPEFRGWNTTQIHAIWYTVYWCAIVSHKVSTVLVQGREARGARGAMVLSAPSIGLGFNQVTCNSFPPSLSYFYKSQFLPRLFSRNIPVGMLCDWLRLPWPSQISVVSSPHSVSRTATSCEARLTAPCPHFPSPLLPPAAVKGDTLWYSCALFHIPGEQTWLYIRRYMTCVYIGKHMQ